MNRSSSFAEAVSFQSALEKKETLGWKKLWCILQDNKLCFYKEGGDRKNPSVAGKIDISQAQSVRAGRGSSFEIVTKSKSKVFNAGTCELRDKWVKALQDSMTIHNRKQSLASRSSSTSCDLSDDDVDVPTTPSALERSNSCFDDNGRNEPTDDIPSAILKTTTSETDSGILPKRDTNTSSTYSCTSRNTLTNEDTQDRGYENANDIQRILHQGRQNADGIDGQPSDQYPVRSIIASDDEEDQSSKAAEIREVSSVGEPSLYSRSSNTPNDLRNVSDTRESFRNGNTDLRMGSSDSTASAKQKSAPTKVYENAADIQKVQEHGRNNSGFPSISENAELNHEDIDDDAFRAPKAEPAPRPVVRRRSQQIPSIPEDDILPEASKVAHEVRIEVDFVEAPIPDLPNPDSGAPRSAFDDMRLFLADVGHTTDSERQYPRSGKDAGGLAIDSLRSFLYSLECE